MKDLIKAFWNKKMSDKQLYRHTWMTRFGAVGTALILVTPGRGNYSDGTWWTYIAVVGLFWSLYQIWWIRRENQRRGL